MNNEPLVMSVDENGHRTQTGDRGIAALRKLPAACSEELQPCESFLQLAARNCNPAKASCSLQREIATCESFLQLAARNCNPAKASCSLQREIATCESFLQLAAGNRNVRNFLK